MMYTRPPLLKKKKCHMMMSEGVVLGHFISSQGIQVDPSKIQVIKDLPTPKNQTQVRSFLGHAGYYRRFIKNFSKIDSPLFVLLMKNVEFKWTNSCQEAFNTLKHQLSTAPILRGPDWTLPFTYPPMLQTLLQELSWDRKKIISLMLYISSARI